MARCVFIRRPKAFTLVELLVVIGIIGLLLSILLPTVNRVRVAGARTACAMQLRQLGNAFQMYLNDHKGVIPGEPGISYGPIPIAPGKPINPMPLTPPAFTGQLTLFDAFDPYLGTKSHKVWNCPADRLIDFDGGDPALVGRESYFDGYGVSYEYNLWMNSLRCGKPFVTILKEAAADPNLHLTATTFRVFNDWTRFHGPAGRNGNMNFLFADWHVGDLEGTSSGKDVAPGGKAS